MDSMVIFYRRSFQFLCNNCPMASIKKQNRKYFSTVSMDTCTTCTGSQEKFDQEKPLMDRDQIVSINDKFCPHAKGWNQSLIFVLNLCTKNCTEEVFCVQVTQSVKCTCVLEHTLHQLNRRKAKIRTNSCVCSVLLFSCNRLIQQNITKACIAEELNILVMYC